MEKLGDDLLNAIITACRESTPLKRKITANPNPWYTEKLAILKAQIDTMLVIRKRARNAEVKKRLDHRVKQLKREYKLQIEFAKETFKTSLNQVNSKDDIWKVLNRNKRLRPETFKTFVKQNGERTSDLKEITGDILDKFLRSSKRKLVAERTTGLRRTNREELQQILKTMKNTAPGPDGVPNAILKKLITSHLDYFVNVFNELLEQMTFPKKWKKVTLQLFQKNGKPLDSASSLRPITLTPTIAKLLEKLFAIRIEESLERQGFMSDRQHGFARSRSTATAISSLLEMMRVARKKRYSVLNIIDVINAIS